jgi:arylsulfatase A-like enzyme
MAGIAVCMSMAMTSACTSHANRTNVLLIVADDLGYNDLAINNGNKAMQTPSLDTLAREGVRFTRHYADSVCSPARAALLTGMSSARLGYVPNGRGLSPQLVTLADALQDAGYHTMHIGKWHVGDTLREAWPDRQGFQHWLGFLNQWYLAGTQQNGQLVASQPRHIDPWLMRDSDAGSRYEGNLDDVLSEEAIGQIKALGGSRAPWFINLWYYSPHAPITPGAEHAAQYPDNPEGRYRAMVRQLDTNVGRVLSALRETGQDRSTLVIFVSDNGGTAQNVLDSNAPFHGAKGSFFEGGLRTPLLIRWPALRRAGEVREDVTAIQDIYPTILGHLGIPPPPGLDGHDIGEAPAPSRDLLWEGYFTPRYGYSLLRDGKWRLYKVWPWEPWEVAPRLFAVNREPGVPADRAGEHPALLASMEQARHELQRDMHRPRLQFERGTDGTGTLTGQDFLRTPGYGGFTFGIGVRDTYAGTVVSQQGIWSMAVSDTGEVVADFQGHRLRAKLPPGECRSVLVSGWFARRTSNWRGDDDRITLSLRINGEQVASHEAEGKLDDAAFAAPTLIGTPGANASNALLSQPLLLIAPVDASDSATAAGLHGELCR